MFQPFPILETPRLILRRTLQSDAADIFEMRSDPEVMRFIPRPIAVTPEDVVPLITMIDDFIDKNEAINWAMQLKDSGKVIGLIGYPRMRPEHRRAEVGYSLSRSFHRKGYMLEALEAVLDYGFTGLQLHSIEAVIDAENIASEQLLEKTGFTREAYFREDFLHNGSFRNSVHYGLLHSDKRRGK